jgi:ribosomal protein L7/L12
MSTQILLIMVGVVVLIVLVLYWQRQGVVKRPSIPSQLPAADWQVDLSAAPLSGDWGEAVGLNGSQVTQINAEIQAGRKIEAIRLYRKFTDEGLREAKEAVEAIERGQKPAFSAYHTPITDHAAGDVRAQIERELRARRKINAIKLYREAYHVGLKEAKDAVDEMERNLPKQ